MPVVVSPPELARARGLSYLNAESPAGSHWFCGGRPAIRNFVDLSSYDVTITRCGRCTR
jgi:hypothetical protein